MNNIWIYLGAAIILLITIITPDWRTFRSTAVKLLVGWVFLALLIDLVTHTW